MGKRINTTDLMAIGLSLISIYLLLSTKHLIGLIGAVILLISQVVYLYQTKVRKWFK